MELKKILSTLVIFFLLALGLTVFGKPKSLLARAFLVHFEAQPLGKRAIKVFWETLTETANLGFNLYRSNCAICQKTKLNRRLIPSQAPGGGGVGYEYIDWLVKPSRIYYYWLESVDISGRTTLHGSVKAALPAENDWHCCKLWQRYGEEARVFCYRPDWCQ